MIWNVVGNSGIYTVANLLIMVVIFARHVLRKEKWQVKVNVI